MVFSPQSWWGSLFVFIQQWCLLYGLLALLYTLMYNNHVHGRHVETPQTIVNMCLNEGDTTANGRRSFFIKHNLNPVLLYC
jgi:hypothetical protein